MHGVTHIKVESFVSAKEMKKWKAIYNRVIDVWFAFLQRSLIVSLLINGEAEVSN
jgi:hypothetical protein